MCHITLADVPKQQYVISRTQNKVYDITERKKFCSNKCYKSSVYLKEQILTTPLWVRKEDDVIPEFKLLSLDDDNTANTGKNSKVDNHPNDKNEPETQSAKDEKKSVETNDSSIPNSD